VIAFALNNSASHVSFVGFHHATTHIAISPDYGYQVRRVLWIRMVLALAPRWLSENEGSTAEVLFWPDYPIDFVEYESLLPAIDQII